jgi:hypothetical protein
VPDDRHEGDDPPPMTTTPNVDRLASLGDRKGWKHTADGWRNAKLDITVRAAGATAYEVERHGVTTSTTTATGALSLVDMLERKAAGA